MAKTDPKRPIGRPPRTGEAAENLTIRLSPTERKAWERAAGDQPLGDWIRERCNRAAARST